MHCRRRICSSAPSAPRAACAQSNHERTQPLMQIHQINVAPSFALINVVFVNSLNTLSSGGIYSQSGFRAFARFKNERKRSATYRHATSARCESSRSSTSAVLSRKVTRGLRCLGDDNAAVFSATNLKGFRALCRDAS